MYILVPKEACQKARHLLQNLNCYNSSKKILKIDPLMVAMPIKDGSDATLIKVHLTEAQLFQSENEISFEKIESTPSTSKRPDHWSNVMYDFCVQKLKSKKIPFDGEEIKNDIPTLYEKHGDLILISNKYFSSTVWSEKLSDDDMNAIWEKLCLEVHAKRVAMKSTITDDDFRSPRVKLVFDLNGGNLTNTWVKHVDNGIMYTWDISKCMFSSGNISEKLRIAKFDCSDETVVDMFAGIGYFTLPYLVHANAKFVHACDWNPDSVDALKKNLVLNQINPSRYQVHFGDNRNLGISNIADRVNLGLIPSSEMSYKAACQALKQDSGGVLHVHGNVDQRVSSFGSSQKTENKAKKGSKFQCKHLSWEKWAEKTANQILDILQSDSDTSKKSFWSVEMLQLTRIKSYAPKVDHLVLDLSCKPATTRQ